MIRKKVRQVKVTPAISGRHTSLRSTCGFVWDFTINRFYCHRQENSFPSLTFNLPYKVHLFNKGKGSLYCWEISYINLSPNVTQKSCCSAAKSCLILCNPMDCSMLGFPVLHHLPEFAQVHVIQSSHPLLPSSPVFNLFQHQVCFNESALCIRWPKY